MQLPIERSWLRHVDDGTRATALRLVGRIIDGIDADRVWIRDHADGRTVEALVELDPDGRGTGPSAVCVLGGSTLNVRAPATADWNDDLLSIVGRVDAPDGPEPLARLREVLHFWRAGLLPAIDREEELAAGRFVNGCAALLRAAAQLLHPAWSAAAVASHAPGVLDVLVELDATAPTRYRVFSSVQAGAPDGTISPDLLRMFEQVVGTGVHLTLAGTDRRRLLPHLQIGPPPAVRIANDGGATSMIRAVAALPPGARLVPVTGR